LMLLWRSRCRGAARGRAILIHAIDTRDVMNPSDAFGALMLMPSVLFHRHPSMPIDAIYHLVFRHVTMIRYHRMLLSGSFQVAHARSMPGFAIKQRTRKKVAGRAKCSARLPTFHEDHTFHRHTQHQKAFITAQSRCSWPPSAAMVSEFRRQPKGATTPLARHNRTVFTPVGS